MSTKTTNLTNKAGEQAARSLSMRALTPGGSALKRSQIFRAHFRPSKMHFIAGIPGSTQRLASCGLKHPTVSKVGQRPETELMEKEGRGCDARDYEELSSERALVKPRRLA